MLTGLSHPHLLQNAQMTPTPPMCMGTTTQLSSLRARVVASPVSALRAELDHSADAVDATSPSLKGWLPNKTAADNGNNFGRTCSGRDLADTRLQW